MVKDEPAHYRIQDLDVNERPRERIAKYGPQALSNAELLAILLRVGLEGENVVQLEPAPAGRFWRAARPAPGQL